MYVSNSSISKTDGYLCYHHEGSGLPSVYQDRNCNHLGQYVIIYNERNETSSYNPVGYSPKAVLELCEVESVLLDIPCMLVTQVYRRLMAISVINSKDRNFHPYIRIVIVRTVCYYL